MIKKLIERVCALATCLLDLACSHDPDVVDLGLSVKWATCNLGASKPEECGKYFAWGDVTGQTLKASEWPRGGFVTYPEYKLDSNGNLTSEYDAAHVNLGGKWRTPTKAECQELIDNCTSTWTDNYNGTGVAGRIFTSNKNGNFIFLPAAGCGFNSDLDFAGSYGRYWSSTFGSDSYGSLAWSLYFYSDDVYTSSFSHRFIGQSVRPVTEQ